MIDHSSSSRIFQILALIVPSTQKHSVLGKPQQLVALIQVLSLGKFVILFEWRTRQIGKYFQFFKKILQIFIFIFFSTLLFPFPYSLSSSSSEPLDKLEACFSTLNISKALVFNFPERAYPERGWFPYHLFWPLYSPLTYFIQQLRFFCPPQLKKVSQHRGIHCGSALNKAQCYPYLRQSPRA